MSFEMALWQVNGQKLTEVSSINLDNEQRLENWIVADSSILGMEIAIIGRQVQTPFGGRIDLLGLDRDANCIVLELKRAKTPREVVAQLLDYGSWVKDLGYNDLDQIAQQWKQKSVASIFQSVFGTQYS